MLIFLYIYPYKPLSTLINFKEKVKIPEVLKTPIQNLTLDGGAKELSSQWGFLKAWHRSIDFFFLNDSRLFLSPLSFHFYFFPACLRMVGHGEGLQK